MCGHRTHSMIGHTIHREPDGFAPIGICRTSPKNVLMVMPWFHKVISVNDGSPSTFAGSGRPGFMSSSSPIVAKFNSPSGICFDRASNSTLIADTGNSVVRIFRGKVESAFVGVPGMKGSVDGVGTDARLSAPSSIKCCSGLVAIADDRAIRTLKSSLSVSTSYVTNKDIIDIAVSQDAIYVLEGKK